MLTLQVGKPTITGIFKARPIGLTLFRKFYQRGDFPIALEHCAKGNRIGWKVCQSINSFLASFLTENDYSGQIPLAKIDYHHYLPLFFEGLRETTHPYEFFARRGTHDLLEEGGALILPVVPQLIMPLKSRKRVCVIPLFGQLK
jgi:hypothetical protein